MSFPLSQVDSVTWERIFNKLGWTAHFRMQRTCKDMAEFIQTSRNIKPCIPETLNIFCDRNKDGKQLRLIIGDLGRNEREYCPDPVDSRPGARFKSINPVSIIGEDEHNLLTSAVKSYRITCNMVIINENNKKECARYLEIFNCPAVWNILGPPLSRDLHSASRLTKIQLNIEYAFALEASQTLLAMPGLGEIHVYGTTESDSPVPIDSIYFMLYSFFQYLCTNFISPLHCFKFGTAWHYSTPSFEEFQNEFSDFNIQKIAQNEKNKQVFRLEHGHQGLICDLIFCERAFPHVSSVEIHLYQSSDERHKCFL